MACYYFYYYPQVGGEAAAAAAGQGENVCKLTAERVTNVASASALRGGRGRRGGAESWQSPYAEGLAG